MRAAVLGSPISHSLSPVIHRAGYAALGLNHDYDALDVAVEAFPGFIASLTTCWMGLSLTMPLKEVAFQVAGEISPEAVLSGSINTLLCGDVLSAENTDIYGIVSAVRERGIEGIGRLVVLGSGATARSAILAGAALGAQTATIVARNASTRLACERLAGKLGMSLSHDTDQTVLLTSDTLVVSTVPAAATAPLIARMPHPDGMLLDVIYHPWPSELVTHWHASGLPIVPGHLMLLHQAVRQFELMTREVAPVNAMRIALESALASG